MNLLLDSASNVAEFGLSIALIVLGVVIGVASIVAFVLRIIILAKYSKFKKQKTQAGYTAFSACRMLLDNNGMQDVKVEKLGFWRATLYGNSYSAKKKTIYLRKNLIDSTDITSVGMALQKVGLAIQDKEGDKQFKTRAKLQPLFMFAPVLFVPIVLIGMLLDAVLTQALGIGTIVTAIIAIVFFVLSIIFTLSTIKVEKKANAKALEIMEKTNFLNAEERAKIKTLFDTFILAYITDFVISILEALRFILQLALKIVQSKNGK